MGRLYAEIVVNLFSLWGPTAPPLAATIWVKFGVEESTEGRLAHAKFHHSPCNVSPLWSENPQNRPP